MKTPELELMSAAELRDLEAKLARRGRIYELAAEIAAVIALILLTLN